LVLFESDQFERYSSGYSNSWESLAPSKKALGVRVFEWICQYGGRLARYYRLAEGHPMGRLFAGMLQRIVIFRHQPDRQSAEREPISMRRNEEID
jgi:hypothetical protein